MLIGQLHANYALQMSTLFTCNIEFYKFRPIAIYLGPSPSLALNLPLCI